MSSRGTLTAPLASSLRDILVRTDTFLPRTQGVRNSNQLTFSSLAMLVEWNSQACLELQVKVLGNPKWEYMRMLSTSGSGAQEGAAPFVGRGHSQV